MRGKKKRRQKKGEPSFVLSLDDARPIGDSADRQSASPALPLSLFIFQSLPDSQRAHFLECRDAVGRVLHQPGVQVGRGAGQVLEVDVEPGAAGRDAAGHAEQGADLGGVDASRRGGGGAVSAGALGVEERREIALDGEALLAVSVHGAAGAIRRQQIKMRKTATK